MNQTPRGSITLIVGGMFAGKSEELVRLLNRLRIAQRKIIAFRPARDTRQPRVKSRAGGEFDAVCVQKASEMLDHAASHDVVGIDEGQFFDEGLRDAVFTLARAGKTVLVAALNADFAGQPFPTVSLLYAIASEIVHVRAICVKCGREASFSQRLSDSRDRFVVGDETYQARCLACYEPPSS